MKSIGLYVRILGVFLLCGVVFSPRFDRHVSAQSPYYQGKTIKLIQGRDPGGSGDIRSRAVIPFLRKYIPGNPTIINEYMPGAAKRPITSLTRRARTVLRSHT
jgi:hypothetical protein